MILGCVKYQTAPHGSLGLPSGFYQFTSLTEGTALLFESLPRLRLPTRPHHSPHPPPTHPPPIESIRDITGAEKKLSKNQQHPSSLLK